MPHTILTCIIDKKLLQKIFIIKIYWELNEKKKQFFFKECKHLAWKIDVNIISNILAKLACSKCVLLAILYYLYAYFLSVLSERINDFPSQQICIIKRLRIVVTIK